jgi:hypothetical protein
VQGQRLRAQSSLSTHGVDEQQRTDVANAGLDGRQAHQLRIELIENVGHVRIAKGRGEVEARASRIVASNGIAGDVSHHRVHISHSPTLPPRGRDSVVIATNSSQ